MIDRSRLPNAFEFVTVASQRAKQLRRGCTPKVEALTRPEKTAQREVTVGAVTKIDDAQD